MLPFEAPLVLLSARLLSHLAYARLQGVCATPAARGVSLVLGDSF